MSVRGVYSAYDEFSGMYTYYKGRANPRIELPEQRSYFMPYHHARIELPVDANPSGTGTEPKGLMVDIDTIPCVPPCRDSAANTLLVTAFLLSLRWMFL